MLLRLLAFLLRFRVNDFGHIASQLRGVESDLQAVTDGLRRGDVTVEDLGRG